MRGARTPLFLALASPFFSAACSEFPEAPEFDAGEGGQAPVSPVVCEVTREALDVSLVGDGGEELRCEPEGLGPAEISVFNVSFDAVVVSATRAGEGKIVWELQSCLGGALGCVGGGAGGSTYTLTVTAPGLDVLPPAGTAVRLAYTSTSAGAGGARGCLDRLEVRDLPASGSESAGYWLAGNLPSRLPSEQAPGGALDVQLAPLAEGCAPDLAACTGAFALLFAPPAGDSDPVLVPMGETRPFELDAASGFPGRYSVRNLSSRLEPEEGGCAPVVAFWLQRQGG